MVAQHLARGKRKRRTTPRNLAGELKSKHPIHNTRLDTFAKKNSDVLNEKVALHHDALAPATDSSRRCGDPYLDWRSSWRLIRRIPLRRRFIQGNSSPCLPFLSRSMVPRFSSVNFLLTSSQPWFSWEALCIHRDEELAMLYGYTLHALRFLSIYIYMA